VLERRARERRHAAELLSRAVAAQLRGPLGEQLQQQLEALVSRDARLPRDRYLPVVRCIEPRV
jgi:hypothetical protein